MSEIEQFIGNERDLILDEPDVVPKEIELNFREFAEILSAGFEGGVKDSTIKSLRNCGILHPLICPRNGSSRLTPRDLLPAYIAISIKRTTGFSQWIDVARLMAIEGSFRNGEAVRETYPWFRIAWKAKRMRIDFDDYPELSPITERA